MALLSSLLLLALLLPSLYAMCICPPGQLKVGDTCKPCPPGTFGDPSSEACTPCPPNTASTTAGAYACTPCGEGSIPAQNTPTKCACKQGYSEEVSHPAVAICQLLTCPPGQYLETFSGADTSCNLCPPGTYKPQGAAQCLVCPEGSYSAYGATKCITCPPGQFVLQSGQCGLCPAGEQPNMDILQCEKCPPGTFKSAAGDGTCQPCAGNSVSLEGATSCLTCNPGDVPIGTTCGKCPPGTEYNALTWNCDSCIRGTYMDAPHTVETCKVCPGGSDSLQGSSECTSCPQGTKMMMNGKCESCKKGFFYNVDDMTCTKCTVNYYSKGGASEICMPCENGTFSNDGADKCFSCPNGKAWMKKTGKCDVCPKGQYYDVFKAECMKCSRFDGIRPLESVKRNCKPCPPGQQADEMGVKCVPITQISYCPIAGGV